VGHPAALTETQLGIQFLKSPGGRAFVINAGERIGGRALFATAADALDFVPGLDVIVAVGQGIKASYDGVEAYKEQFDQCMAQP